MPTIYGLSVPSEYRRGVIAEPETSATGNVVLRVGAENPSGSWSQTEHVVLTPGEARDLAGAILSALAYWEVTR